MVAGAASGIGMATCKKLLEVGATVFATDMNEERMKEAFGGMKNVHIIKMDVTSTEQVNAAAKFVSSKVSKLDGVVNSAGVPFAPRYPKTWVQGVIELDVDEWVKPVVDINLLGTMRVNHALFPLLWEARGATIFNIASIGGLIAAHGMGPYAASKFGVVGYSDALRRELAPYRIRVVTLEPGFLRTELAHNIFDAPSEYDYSHTRLFAGRGGGSEASPVKTGDLPPPDLVSDEIYRLLFIDHHIPCPRLIVDTTQNFVFWNIATNISHSWLDYVMEPSRSRKEAVEEKWRASASI